MPLPAVASRSALASGRLDAWFGSARGERIRAILGRIHLSKDPGGEWPHSYHGVGKDETDFWRIAASTDGLQSEMDLEKE
jgi:hypothetical protein